MEGEYLRVDVHGLVRLAVLVDGFYRGAHGLLGEIRLQEARFGLSPQDRERLRWEVPRVEEPERERAQLPMASGDDPRRLLAVLQ